MRYPFATWIGSPNFGYPRDSHGQNHPIAIVDHVMQGYLVGCDSWFRNPDSWSSAHFGIGKAGAIHQYVDTDDAAWANGAVNKPSPAGAALAALGNPNVLTVSIEHEGFSGEEWTEAMYQADLRLKRWLVETHGKMGESHVLILLGHYDIDSVTRAGCPGPTWPKDRLLAELQQEEDDMTLQRELEIMREFASMSGELFQVEAAQFGWWAVAGGDPVAEAAAFKVLCDRWDAFRAKHIDWRRADSIP